MPHWGQHLLKGEKLAPAYETCQRNTPYPKQPYTSIYLEVVTKTVGRKKVFSDEEEEELKKCITDMAELGFALKIHDIGEVVESYVMFDDSAS